MKKPKSVFIILLLLISLSSCTNCYMSDGTLDVVKQKTTYKSFSQLNQPIVISIPQYENFYLFGNKNNKSKSERIGDMFVIIDIESNEIYDWVFYPGKHGWSVWRLIEAGADDNLKYLFSSPGTKSVAIVDPNKTSVETIYTGINDNMGLYRCYDYKVPQCYINSNNYITDIIDVESSKIAKKEYVVSFKNPLSILDMRSSPNGDLWFLNDKDNYFYLNKISKEDETLECGLISFESKNERSKNFNEGNASEFFAVRYVTEDNVFIACHPWGVNMYGNWVYVYNINDKTVREISLENGEYSQFLYDIQETNGNYYAILPNTIDSGVPREVNIYKLDIENFTSTKEISIPFDMTDNTYVRGSRIYFMNSRSLSHPSYTYYDTETKSQGPVYSISDSEIIKEYLGE